jgi:HK97 gp10 family phage protein
MNVKMKFEGGQELAKMLDQLSMRVGKKVLTGALMDGGELIRAHAERIAPRAPGAPDIADNIGMSTAKTNVSSYVGGGEQAAIKIGPVKGYAYGLPQELGTSRHAAQPFMRPAFDAKAAKALPVIAQSLWVELAARGVHRTASAPSGLRGSDAFTQGRTGLKQPRKRRTRP